MTRRRFLQYGVGAGAALALPWAVRAPVATAAPGGKLTKYLEPLPLPGAGIVVATPSGPNQYSFTQTEIARQLHPDLPPTPLWAYDDGSGLGGSGRLVRDGGRRAERHAARRRASRTPCPATYPDWLPVDTRLTPLGQRGAADDPPARRLRRGRQRRQPRGHAERVRPRRDADRLLHQPDAADAGVAAVVPRPRPGHDAAERVRRARRRLHPPRRVRHRRRAEPDRDPRRRLRDPAGRPGPPVQRGRDVPVPDQRHPGRDLDRRVLRRRHARQRQGLAVPGRRAAACTGSAS